MEMTRVPASDAGLPAVEKVDPFGYSGPSVMSKSFTNMALLWSAPMIAMMVMTGEMLASRPPE